MYTHYLRPNYFYFTQLQIHKPTYIRNGILNDKYSLGDKLFVDFVVPIIFFLLRFLLVHFHFRDRRNR